MNTLVIQFTVIFVLLATGLIANNGSSTTGDEPNSNVRMNIKNDKQVELRLEGLPVENVTIEIFNNQGNQLDTENIICNRKNRVCHDIEGMDEGLYTYLVKENNKVVYAAKIFKSDDGSVEIRSEDAGANASISQTDDDHVLVRLVKNANAKTKIKVWDEKGHYLHIKTIKKGTILNLTHDISEFPGGEYMFGVFHDDELIALRKVAR